MEFTEFTMMEGIFYKGIWRMDWGLGNPNKTAALIATLMVAVWALAYVRRWGFWAALALFTGLGVCLIHTFSRGGLIAAFSGLVVVMCGLPRPPFQAGRVWSRRRMVAVVFSVWVMIGCSVYLEAHQRFAQGVVGEDRSITHRLALWKTAPRMMRDAPEGWGLGNSGDAYMQWYQPLDRHEAYRTLVNSHLTWLVEFGWPMRFFYVMGWFSVFALCWPTKTRNGELDPLRTGQARNFDPAVRDCEQPQNGQCALQTSDLDHRASINALCVPLGVWVAFAVAALFSSVAESPCLWVVPGIALLAVLGYRIKCRAWPRPRIWLLPLGMAVLVVGAFFLFGMGKPNLRGSADLVILGEGTPQIWLVADGKVFEKNYGRKLREFLQTERGKRSTIAVVKSAASLGDVSGKMVILGGNLAAQDKAKVQLSLKSAERVILVNPLFFPKELNFSKGNTAKVEVAFGEFSQSPAVDAWAGVATVRRMEGAGDFLPRWPELLLATHP